MILQWVGFIKSLLEELSDSMIIPAKERMTITRSTRFHLQISSYNIVSVRSTFGLLLYNTIVQFTFIESDYKVVNKATASDNHLLKWPLETRKLFARGRGTYLTMSQSFSLRFIFNQKTSIYLTLIQCILVFSPNVCSLSQKKNRILRWVISIAGRTSLRTFFQAFVLPL